MKEAPGALFVVIPAYNEAKTVGRVVQKVQTCLPHARVLVVNDGSRDNTGRAAREAGAWVIDLPVNMGYGVALQTGLMFAHRNRAEYVVTLDADGQHDPADIPQLLAPVASALADIALGSRYLEGGARYAVPIARRLGSWLFAGLASALMHCKITDPTTGFQCLNATALGLCVSLPDFPEKTPDVDMILYAHFHGCRIREVPVPMYEDEGHDSMHGFVDSLFYAPKMILAVIGIVLAKFGTNER
ncbi:MAG: glycosyltransferase family 2 protein [Bryobacteraceae bacterium]